MGKIISNGIEYVGLTNINGVFIDTNNVIVPQTSYSISMNYIATEDCIVALSSASGNNTGCQVQIDGKSVGGVEYSTATIQLLQYYFLKKGQTISVSNSLIGSQVGYAVYGIQQGSTSQGSSGGIDYSTTEQKTGQKWIDGRDIYQTTIEIQVNSLTGGQENTVIHGISNFGQLVKKESIYNYTNGDMNTDVVNPTVQAWFIQVHDVGDTDFSVYVGSSAYAQLSKIYVTFQYTKATT